MGWLKRFMVTKKDERGKEDGIVEKIRSRLKWLYKGKVKRSKNNKGGGIKKMGYWKREKEIDKKKSNK